MDRLSDGIGFCVHSLSSIRKHCSLCVDWGKAIFSLTHFEAKVTEKKIRLEKREQCFSYRRFFGSPDASTLIWTQVECFGRFIQVQFSMRLLRVEPPKSKSKYRVSTEE